MTKPEGMAMVTERAKLRIDYGLGKPGNMLIHVRAIVDEGWVVFRSWRKRRGWRYYVEPLVYFEELLANGRLTYEGQDNGQADPD